MGFSTNSTSDLTYNGPFCILHIMLYYGNKEFELNWLNWIEVQRAVGFQVGPYWPKASYVFCILGWNIALFTKLTLTMISYDIGTALNESGIIINVYVEPKIIQIGQCDEEISPPQFTVGTGSHLGFCKMLKVMKNSSDRLYIWDILSLTIRWEKPGGFANVDTFIRAEKNGLKCTWVGHVEIAISTLIVKISSSLWYQMKAIEM